MTLGARRESESQLGNQAALGEGEPGKVEGRDAGGSEGKDGG